MNEYSINLPEVLTREITDPTLFEIGEEMERNNLFNPFYEGE